MTSRVRIHRDAEAVQLNKQISAQAFTQGSDVYFNSGKYDPGSREGKRLLAHELTHVVQQGASSHSVDINRKLEVRPPGKGEASAYDRRMELVDRLNAQSKAIQYRLEGNNLLCDIFDEKALTYFDQQMKTFIDRGEIVPMRLITKQGLIGDPASGYEPLFTDSFISAYVDLDDLMADDKFSFQSDLMHFLTERFSVKNYEQKIGTDFSSEFEKSHKAGKNAEAALLQSVLNDPSITFNYEEKKPNGTWVNAFKSKDQGYRIYQIVRKSNQYVVGGKMYIQLKGSEKLIPLETYLKEQNKKADVVTEEPVVTP